MRKPITILTLGLAIVGLLAGCGQKKADGYHQTSAQFNDQGPKSKKAPSAKNASAENKASESDHQVKKIKPYHVPAKEAANKDYVKSGNLTKQHQFTYDQAGTRVSLAKTRKANRTVSNGKVAFHFTQVRLMKNQPKTQAALKMAQQALNTDAIKGTYYTLQIKYTVTNHRQQTVNIDGLTALKTNNGQTLTPATQMYDAGAGTQLKAGKHKSAFAMALITDPNSVKQVKIEVGGIYTPSGKTLANATASHYLQIKQ